LVLFCKKELLSVTYAYVLRDAVPEDSADIARLVLALADYEKLASQAVGTEADFRAQLFGPAPRAHCMIAEVQGRVAGFALWFYNFSTFLCRPGLYVEDIFVEPEHRGLGIGRAFFRALARRALDEGCGRMEWAVLDWNEPSISFYRSLGAVGMDEWTVQRLDGEKIRKLAEEA
jgi:GNAT superfamily N-acetyltransferase